MERCSPHAWRTPVVGDPALVCDVCEHRLDLARDITPEVQADLLRDYRRHFGPIVSRNFEEALAAAGAAPPPPAAPAPPGGAPGGGGEAGGGGDG
ncbi:MAG: hypothetical protein OXI57_06165, partial [Rhodospirillales bacterium]|nr:hypothetical protein [Rhodospirillales bacterium]